MILTICWSGKRCDETAWQRKILCHSPPVSHVMRGDESLHLEKSVILTICWSGKRCGETTCHSGQEKCSDTHSLFFKNRRLWDSQVEIYGYLQSVGQESNVMKLIFKENVVLCTNILLVIGRDVITLPVVKEKVVSLTYYWSWDKMWWNWLEMQSAVSLTSCWSWDKAPRLYDKKMQCYSHAIGNQKQCGWKIKNVVSLTAC